MFVFYLTRTKHKRWEGKAKLILIIFLAWEKGYLSSADQTGKLGSELDVTMYTYM